ncbi:MAG: flagellar protein FlaG, partial [Planctomycetes bacterium]|nr:flagellar protein FlaG [Planctomycetota bacterium]
SYDPASANNGRNASDTDIINQTAAERRDAEHEQEAEPEQLDSAVNQANETMAMRNRSIRFRVHSDNNKIQIQVYDPNKDKVLLSIPSDEMIALSTRMRELSGMAVGSVVDLSQ